MNRYQINKTKITFENGVVVSFEFPIGQVIEFDSVLVVRLEIPPRSVFNENVFGYDFKGKKLWQVKKMPAIHADSPYTGMSQSGDNVKIFNWDCMQVTLKATTGKILKKEFLK